MIKPNPYQLKSISVGEYWDAVLEGRTKTVRGGWKIYPKAHDPHFFFVKRGNKKG